MFLIPLSSAEDKPTTFKSHKFKARDILNSVAVGSEIQLNSCSDGTRLKSHDCYIHLSGFSHALPIIKGPYI